MHIFDVSAISSKKKLMSNLSRTVLRYTPGKDLELTQESTPNISPDSVVITVLAVGVCGTDMHILEGTFAAVDGVILGHEISGVVDSIGSAVDHLHPGDLVSLEPHWYCGSCTYCRDGQEHHCTSKKGYGVKLDGGMATQIVVPGRVAYLLPPKTGPLIGAMAEPLSCAVHAMERLNPRLGESILISGAGPSGAILINLAKARGLHPIVVLEPSEQRRQTALEMGATHALDPASFNSAADSRELCPISPDKDGYHNAVDAVGKAGVIEQLIPRLRKGGKLLCFGVAAPDDSFPLYPRGVFESELTIIGSIINPYTHERSVSLLEALPLEKIPVKVFSLENFAEAFEAQRQADEKIFISPNPELLARYPPMPRRRCAGMM